MTLYNAIITIWRRDDIVEQDNFYIVTDTEEKAYEIARKKTKERIKLDKGEELEIEIFELGNQHKDLYIDRR